MVAGLIWSLCEDINECAQARRAGLGAAPLPRLRLGPLIWFSKSTPGTSPKVASVSVLSRFTIALARSLWIVRAS
jgi:hypothetical protein